MVLKFISALLRANKNEQEEFYARQIPVGVFRTNKAEIKWLYDYRDRHRRYPTVAAFTGRFPESPLPRTKETVATSVQAIIDADILEQLSKTISEGKRLYEDGGRTAGEVLVSMRSALNDIQTHDMQFTDVRAGDGSKAVKRYTDRVKAAIEGDVSFEPSPWPTYNKLVGYSEWGESTIIASRTSIGKTWLVLQWAWHLARRGERVLFVSKEMPTHQVLDRATALAYRLPYEQFRKAELDPVTLRRWKQKMQGGKISEQLDNLIITGHETVQGVGFGHIITKIDQYRPTTLVIDGAYLIYPENLGRNASLVERIIRISNTVKGICKAKKLRGFSVIQVKREAENKEGETSASLKDLFGGDAWAQDADNVLLISGKRGSPVRKLSLAKGRESQLGEFNLSFKLHPYPQFKETLGVASITSGTGTVSFSTV